MPYDWPGIIALVLWVGVSIVIFIGRNWLLARIANSVQHGFNVQLESVRAELRTSEERLKSALRDKEAEISSLRTTILSSSANRQDLLDKRRFQAVERVWTAVNDLWPLKNLAASLAVLNVSAISKQAHDPKMQRFISTFDSGLPAPTEMKNVARDEQPFLPQLAWAYYDAYRTVVIVGYSRYHSFKTGIEDPDQYLNFEPVKNILKTTLPECAQWIDANKPESFYYLLDELEKRLLAELRKVLDGQQADQASIEKASGIMDAVNKSRDEQAKAVADSRLAP